MNPVPEIIQPTESYSKGESSKLLGCIFGCLTLFLAGLCVFLFAGDLGFSLIKSWFTSTSFSLSEYFLDNYPDLLKPIGLIIGLFGISLLQFKFTSSLGLWLMDLSSVTVVVFGAVGIAASTTTLVTMMTTSPLNYLPQMTNDISIGIRVGSYVGIPIALIQLILVTILRFREIMPRVVPDTDYFLDMLPTNTLFLLIAGVISGSIAGHERWGWLGVMLGIATGILIPLVLFVKIIYTE